MFLWVGVEILEHCVDELALSRFARAAKGPPTRNYVRVSNPCDVAVGMEIRDRFVSRGGLPGNLRAVIERNTAIAVSGQGWGCTRNPVHPETSNAVRTQQEYAKKT